MYYKTYTTRMHSDLPGGAEAFYAMLIPILLLKAIQNYKQINIPI